YQKIVERNTARIADAEREALARMADRPPHLHDGETAVQQRVGFLRQQVAHALRAGPLGVIVVRAAHDLADLARLTLVVVGGAQGMVEDDDARGAALGLHQRLHLRIIDAADLVVVEEVDDLGVVANETEAMAIERERVGAAPRIVDRRAVRIWRAPRARCGWGRRARLREQLLAVVENVVDGRLDGFADRFPFDNLYHGQLLRLAGCIAGRRRRPQRTAASYRPAGEAGQSPCPGAPL